MTNSNNNLTPRQVRERIEQAMALLEEARELVDIDQDDLADAYDTPSYEAWKVAGRAEGAIGHAVGSLDRYASDIKRHFEAKEVA